MDADKEIGRFIAVTNTVNDVREQFTIGFQTVDEGNVDMILEWDQSRAPCRSILTRQAWTV